MKSHVKNRLFDVNETQLNYLKDLGNIYLQKGEYDIGIKYLEEYLKLFPNPTDGILNFSTSSNIEELQILDLHGKIILETNLNTNNGSIDLKNFNKGIYTVKAFSKTGIIHEKIILH